MVEMRTETDSLGVVEVPADKPSDLLGGMWAVAATIFVFRDTHSESLSAGVSRLIATSVSFALCLALGLPIYRCWHLDADCAAALARASLLWRQG
jgi:hypothetical protein